MRLGPETQLCLGAVKMTVLERAGSKIHLAGEEKESIHISSVALGLQSSHSGQQRRPLLSPKVKLFHMIFFFQVLL